LAVWIDEIQKEIGNPLAIEIKVIRGRADLGSAIAQLTRYLESAGVKADVVLYAGPDLHLERNVAQSVPPILAFSFEEFANLIESDEFPSALKASFAAAKRMA
jgi:hypothetical protein